MKKWALGYIAVTFFFISCNGQDSGGYIASQEDNKLTCIVPGFDSAIYYYGSSNQIRDIKRGKISDTVFMNGMFLTVKDKGLALSLKPGAGAEVIADLTRMVSLSNDHEITRRSIDSLDANEEKAFGYTTPPDIKGYMRGQHEPLKLNLPRDNEKDTVSAIANFPQASRLVILLNGGNDIYVYPAGDIHGGKKYTYAECRELLKARKPDKNFSVMIKPSANSTYKNTVNMLDEMKTVGIGHYALVDIGPEEEEYLRQIYR